MFEKSKHYPIFNPHPKQEEFFNDDSERVLYMGGRPSVSIPMNIKENEMTGKIARISGTTFGFIRKDGTDYFFHRDDFNGHWNDLMRDLDEGDVEVKFTVAESAKGPRAANVSRIDHPNQVG